MQVQVVDISPYLDAGHVRQALGRDARSGNDDEAQRWKPPARGGGDYALQQRRADCGAADRVKADFFVLAVPQALPQ